MRSTLALKLTFLITIIMAVIIGVMVLASGRPRMAYSLWTTDVDLTYATSVLGLMLLCSAFVAYLMLLVSFNNWHRQLMVTVAILSGSALLCYLIACGLSWRKIPPLFEAWVLAIPSICLQLLLFATVIFFTSEKEMCDMEKNAVSANTVSSN
ncbi:hypothetical protein CRM22_006092 [Opisthorchis felineus]|uniref:Uncharacterized protein n=1 Tax=Opisthorchis felineus TaxID=147828 RepID=A0A4V3SEL4_OPIFE|nr:hypothetical protein CRM22_006092 [Opisthorchis felineus]